MRLPREIFFAILVIPTHSAQNWDIEKYSHIPGHKIEFSKSGIQISVIKSASPIIYPLNISKSLAGFSIQGTFNGLPNLKNIQLQGEKNNDDFPLRIGFVVPGSQKLTGVKKWLAPDWVKRLYSKAASGSGIKGIEFFNFVQNKDLIGKSRIHPLSNLITEHFIFSVEKPGSFKATYQLPQPLPIAALWLGIDGDDTKSNFVVQIEEIKLFIVD